VVGDKEVSARQVAVRTREGLDSGVLSIVEFVEKLKNESRLKI
jgi:threonyl-tRNA synthetase